MQDVTGIIDMNKYLDNTDEHVRLLCLHGRAMVLMYQATGDDKYWIRAEADLIRVKTIRECGFVRPVGCAIAS